MRTSAWVTILGLAGLAGGGGGQPPRGGAGPEPETRGAGRGAGAPGPPRPGAGGDQPTGGVRGGKPKAGRGGAGGGALATAGWGEGFSIAPEKDVYHRGVVAPLAGAGWPPEGVIYFFPPAQPQTHPPLQWTV